ncbi:MULTISPECIES: hypothetical protein [Shewanella]|uniref:Uncharacterized protein n=1 Tax=Shewanella algae TaxID=38313 RepID=A0A5N5TX02_9GAMM|nr:MULTISPECIES: hypothetical protein [Shewanella]AYV11748.1 hypothetical protein EEY24_01915 [Shewanella algae]EKT4489854.1 hypothetical protein [Shewanella algae]MBO2550295.1 hypothetical protein [Shewanella algae]MBO2558879.1 hypothetical protein [Shewanella algae]MBO2563136.1 hypothetical protein [Shewanella algae]
MAQEATRFGCTGWKLVITGRYLVDKDGLLGVTEDDWIMMSQFGHRYLQETQESVWKTDNEKSCRESCQKKKDIDRESRIASKET